MRYARRPIGLAIWLLFAAAALVRNAEPAAASPFTPLEWQQVVPANANPILAGQRKHAPWARDPNRRFIDAEILKRFGPGQRLDVIVDLNRCMTYLEIQRAFQPFGKVSYIGKLITYVLLDSVKFTDLSRLAALPQVAMVEWRPTLRPMDDVSGRTIQSAPSNTYAPNDALDLGFTGKNVTIAVLDGGVDRVHEAFAGKIAASVDCTAVQSGCGPPSNFAPSAHATWVAGIALGAATAGRVCRTPDDGSSTDCAGVARDAQLVDVKVCATEQACNDVMKGFDWVGINAQTLHIGVVNYSGGDCAEDQGESALSKAANYLAAIGIAVVVPHGNASNCTTAAGTMLTGSPGAASLAITVAGTNDNGTVVRDDDVIFADYLIGPRADFMTSQSPLALKPDIAAPALNIWAAAAGTGSAPSGFYSSSVSGTSFAAPHVAGVAALVLQKYPGIDPGSLKQLLKSTAATPPPAAQAPAPPFPSVDPSWNPWFGSGIVNAYNALTAGPTTDLKFPSCVSPPPSQGAPCGLGPGRQVWENDTDITLAKDPQVNVMNTITAQVQNTGNSDAVAVVQFGIYSFAIGNNTFFDIGAQTVTVPANSTIAVTMPWTPVDTNHQCVQVSIHYAFDSDYSNNVTQRNLTVAPGDPVFTVRVENPLMRRAKIDVVTRSSNPAFPCTLNNPKADASFLLDPFQDCPHNVTVDFVTPPGRIHHAKVSCRVMGYATAPGGPQHQLIGGVTMVIAAQ